MNTQAETIPNAIRLFVPEEERASAGERRESYTELVRRLSRQSVAKHFDAYADVDWDAPEMAIDVADPRWQHTVDDTLGQSAWYQSLPPDQRSRIALHLVASFMKIGAQFEGILKRGLIEYAGRLPNGSPEFRYAYHEVIEEAQHSLMFQEFVNRSGFDVPGLTGSERLASRFIDSIARSFPELFFVFVLGGEDPIDHVQRKALRRGAPVPPLLRRIMQIHVTEEARHLCFARHFLKERVPALGPARRTILAVAGPIILAIMSQLMMRPAPHIVEAYDIPKDVIAEVYTKNPEHRANTIAALDQVRSLFGELGLVNGFTRRLWQALGIWA